MNPRSTSVSVLLIAVAVMLASVGCSEVGVDPDTARQTSIELTPNSAAGPAYAADTCTDCIRVLPGSVSPQLVSVTILDADYQAGDAPAELNFGTLNSFSCDTTPASSVRLGMNISGDIANAADRWAVLDNGTKIYIRFIELRLPETMIPIGGGTVNLTKNPDFGSGASINFSYLGSFETYRYTTDKYFSSVYLDSKLTITRIDLRRRVVYAVADVGFMIRNRPLRMKLDITFGC